MESINTQQSTANTQWNLDIEEMYRSLVDINAAPNENGPVPDTAATANPTVEVFPNDCPIITQTPVEEIDLNDLQQHTQVSGSNKQAILKSFANHPIQTSSSRRQKVSSPEETLSQLKKNFVGVPVEAVDHFLNMLGPIALSEQIAFLEALLDATDQLGSTEGFWAYGGIYLALEPISPYAFRNAIINVFGEPDIRPHLEKALYLAHALLRQREYVLPGLYYARSATYPLTIDESAEFVQALKTALNFFGDLNLFSDFTQDSIDNPEFWHDEGDLFLTINLDWHELTGENPFAYVIGQYNGLTPDDLKSKSTYLDWIDSQDLAAVLHVPMVKFLNKFAVWGALDQRYERAFDQLLGQLTPLMAYTVLLNSQTSPALVRSIISAQIQNQLNRAHVMDLNGVRVSDYMDMWIREADPFEAKKDSFLAVVANIK